MRSITRDIEIAVQPGQPPRMLRVTETVLPTPATPIKSPLAKKSRPGLGDRLEKVLAAVGITQTRYKQLKAIAGYQPTCGCAARKAFLNEMPRALIWGFLRGGVSGAWEAGTAKAREIKARFAKPASP